MRKWALSFVGGLLMAPGATALAQDYTKDPNFGDLRLKESFLPDPQSVTVTSGGDVQVDVTGCDYGFVSSAPDVDLYYTTTGGTGLYVYVEGDGDTMLLINTPGGDWVCNDDGHGELDPMLYFADAKDGLYDIWVGSFSKDTHGATLYVSEIDPGGSSSSDEPDVSLDPTYGDVKLDERFRPDPHAVSLLAGGSLDVNFGSCNYGHVSSAPDVDFYYTATGGSPLYIYVDGAEDTMLLVNRPDGSWVCDDDSLGDGNPVLAFPKAVGGLYDIWVGTYGDDLTDATLYISSKDPR
jgi:hypothetical protein